MAEIDSLQIEINTKAKQVDDTIDVLVKKLDLLSNSLKNINSINTSGLKKIANNFNNINKTTSSMDSGLTRINTSAQKTTKSFGGLASSIGKFYATWFFVIRGIKKLGSSIESTADYIEAFNYFNVALGKIGSDWSNQFEKYGYENAEAYAESFSQRLQQDLSGLSGLAISTDASGNGLLSSTGMKNLGLNIQEITQFASQLASVTNSVGQTGEVSLATANAFTKLGADMSSLFNRDYSSVMKNLQSGLIGQSRALYKYGIDITNATLQTYSYELGLSKAVSEMTQAEKMQLRMIAILDQSKVSWGDLANTINSPSNMLRQFSNNLKEVGMVLGQLFIPLMQKVMPVINGITISIKNLLTSIAGFLGIKLDLSSFGQGFSGIEDDVGGFTDSLDQATESAKKLKKATTTLGIDELNINAPQEDSGGTSSSGGVGGGIDLTQQILDATKAYEDAWQEAFDRMENKAEVFAKKIENVLEPVKKLFKDISIGDWFAVGQDVTNIVVGITDFFSRAIENVDWQEIGNNIGEFLKGIDLTKILDSFGELFWNAVEAIITLWASSFSASPIETGVITAIGLLTWTGLGPALLSSLIKNLPKIILPKILIEISTFSFSFLGTASFDVIASEILGGIEDAIAILLPKWAEELLGNIVAGLVVGAVLGSWIPFLGPFAGAVAGGIIGSLMGIEIDGVSLLQTIAGKIFNFDSASMWFEKAIESFETAFDGKREGWLDIGGNIFEGIVEGLIAAITYITEPFTDLFWWIWDGICGIFGINSPAEEMKPLGEYILLGILEGFTGAFKNIKETIEDLLKKFDTFKENISQWCSDTKEKISTWSDDVSKKITEWKENAETKFADWKKNAEEKFAEWKINTSNTVEEWGKNIKDKLSEWKNNTSTTINTWRTDLENKFSAWKKNISNTVNSWKTDVESKLNTWKTNSSEKITSWKTSTEKKFKDWKSNASSSINSWKTDTEGKFNAWKTNVVSKIDSWKTDAQNKINTFKTNTSNTIESWKTTVSDKFNTFKSNSCQKIADWKSDAESKFKNFGENTKNTISGWYDKVTKFFGKDKWSFDGVKNGLSKSFESAVDGVKKVWNTFANWLNDKLTWKIDPIKVEGITIFDGITIKLGKIPTFATGGFPEDGFFFANHNELVGRFSNGKNVVANNEQIVSGIERGVERAVANILAPYLADIAQNTRETADKEFTTYIGDREIARANARGQRSMGYTLITEG